VSSDESQDIEQSDAQLSTGLLDGFDRYFRAPEDIRKEAYSNGLIVLDTNALLDVYRLSATAREELLALLQVLRLRLFVPHQVAEEFHANRVEAVSSRTKELDGAASELETTENKTRAIINSIKRRALWRGEDESTAVLTELTSAFEAAKQLLDQVRSDYDLNPEDLVGKVDPVLERLANILEGKVASQPPTDVLQRDRTEAKRRLEEEIPPGFGDKRKGEESYGDYLLWAETLRRAAQTQPPYVVLVTNEHAKGDWTFSPRSLKVGPHHALVAEMYEQCGARLLLRATGELLADAHLIGATVSETTVAEARELPTPKDNEAEIVEAVRGAVLSSPSPLASSSAAAAALRVDPDLASEGWLGYGTFINFVRSKLPDLAYEKQPPGYLYDPAVHDEQELPKRSVYSFRPDRGSTLSMVWKLTDVPRLQSAWYRTLFQCLAVEAEQGALDPRAAPRVRDCLKDLGVPVGRQAPEYVIRGIQMSGESLDDSPTPAQLADVFARSISARIAAEGVHLSADEFQEIREWFGANES
jgi:hypothetical protein